MLKKYCQIIPSIVLQIVRPIARRDTSAEFVARFREDKFERVHVLVLCAKDARRRSTPFHKPSLGREQVISGGLLV